MRLATLVVSHALCALVLTNSAFAQTWSSSRSRPSLFDIIAVDATADTSWPFGHEDIAGDGLDTVEQVEAFVDLRSLYVSARAQRLWLRSYVTANSKPDVNALFLFFIDTDVNVKTGGKAVDEKFWPTLSPDPSLGGYERAIVLRGDGTLSALYVWNSAQSRWDARASNEQTLTVESGVARDPLRLLGDDHGYVQVQMPLSDAGLLDTCLANFFVRTWRSQPMSSKAPEYGDFLDAYAVGCHPRLDRFGNPAVLRSDVCISSASCPAAGSCSDGICVFGYECNDDDACASNERCASNVCVRVVERSSCVDDGDCSGLVCDSDRCESCTAATCGADLVCVPDGRCLDPATPGASPGPAAVSGEAGELGQRGVRGGALSCALTDPSNSRGELHWLSVMGLGTLVWLQRRRKKRVRAAGGES